MEQGTGRQGTPLHQPGKHCSWNSNGAAVLLPTGVQIQLLPALKTSWILPSLLLCATFPDSGSQWLHLAGGWDSAMCLSLKQLRKLRKLIISPSLIPQHKYMVDYLKYIISLNVESEFGTAILSILLWCHISVCHFLVMCLPCSRQHLSTPIPIDWSWDKKKRWL